MNTQKTQWHVVTTDYQKPGYPYAVIQYTDKPSGNEVISAHVRSKEEADMFAAAPDLLSALKANIEAGRIGYASLCCQQDYTPEAREALRLQMCDAEAMGLRAISKAIGDDVDVEPFTEREMKFIRALRAIEARVHGDFDNPELIKLGCVFTSMESDILRLAQEQLKSIGDYK